MKDALDIDTLLADLDRACKDPETPAWVVALLRTVIALVRAMQQHFKDVEEQLKEENARLRKQLYGQRSERRKKPKAPPKQEPRPPRTGKSKLDETEMEEQVCDHPVPEQDKQCPQCGGEDFVDIGSPEESLEYEVRPAKLVRIRHRRQKCACRNGCTVITAPPTPRVTEGGRFGPRTHASIVTLRLLDAIPFHRQAEQWQRSGVPLSASTICDLFHACAAPLEPLYRAAVNVLRASPLVHADETPQPVIDIDKTRRSFVWVFGTKTLAVFVHAASRSGETPRLLLDKTVGTLVADAFSGYNAIEGPDSRRRSGCLAHGRRKFIDAESSAPEQVEWIVLKIGELYAIEQEACDLGIEGSEAHLALRKAKSAPLMAEILAWLLEQKKTARPKSALGKAVRYMLNQWKRLTVFLEDAEVPLDNNHAERLLRRIALARKNSLFIGYDASGVRYAMLMSLVASCRLNGIDPVEYLADVLIRVQTHPARQVRELLPDRWRPTGAEPSEARADTG